MESFGLIEAPPEPNFFLAMGDAGSDVVFQFRVRKTLFNRIKYWLFCKFFPFRITKWDDIKKPEASIHSEKNV